MSVYDNFSVIPGPDRHNDVNGSSRNDVKQTGGHHHLDGGQTSKAATGDPSTSDEKANQRPGSSQIFMTSTDQNRAVPPLEPLTVPDWKLKQEGVECVTGPTPPAYTNPAASMWPPNQQTCVIINQPPASPRPLPVTYVHTDEPAQVTCHNCSTRVTTYCYFETGTCTYISCCLLMIVGCDLGCCLLPFCMDRCKDVIHKCPKCHVILGRYKRL